MVRRTELTPEVVNETVPPTTGEIRIADTKCQGFGFRIWRSAGGRVGRAFDLRAKDGSGRFTRRTYKRRYIDPILVSWNLECLRGTFGFYLEDAREWAEDERYRIAGLPTPGEINAAERILVRDTARASSFLQNAERFLDHGLSNGWSEAYCDGIGELLHLLPDELLHTALGDITAEQLVDGLVVLEAPTHRVLKLREFVSKMAGSEVFANPAHQLWSRESSDLFAHEFEAKLGSGLQAEYEIAYEFLPKILAALEGERELRCQANALQLYFATGSKQAPLLRGRWAMILKGIWYPYFPDEQASWYLARERLDPEAIDILDRQKQLVAEKFPGSPFLFPSESSGGTKPITSVDRCWRKALKNSGWNFDRDGSPRLRNFALVAKNRTSPAAIASSSFYRTNRPYTEDASLRGRVCDFLNRLHRAT